MSFTIAIALAMLLAMPVPASARTPPSSSERTTFREDGASFTPKVALNAAVLKALAKTSEAEYLRDTHPAHPEQFFRATDISLRKHGNSDLIVGGLAPLTGGDNAWFWLVTSPDENPRVVLFAQGSVEVLRSFTNGFRNIQSLWCSPNECITEVYHYRSHRYHLFKKSDVLAVDGKLPNP